MNILINLKTCQVIAKTKSLKSAEYLAELKCPNDPFYICGDEKRWFAKFTLMELGLMYKGLVGSKLNITDYPKALALVHEYVCDLKEWDQSESELRVALGRDLEPTSPLPVKERATRSPSPRAPGEKPKYTRPKEGTTTAKVWDICDQLMAELGEIPTRPEAIQRCVEMEINAATASTQYGKWKGSQN